jgi:hypothetical protein
MEKLIHSNHPEAIAGGVGWHIDALPIWREDCRVLRLTSMPPRANGQASITKEIFNHE